MPASPLVTRVLIYLLVGDPNPITRSRALEHFRKTVGLEGDGGVHVNVNQQTAIAQSAQPRSLEEAHGPNSRTPSARIGGDTPSSYAHRRTTLATLGREIDGRTASAELKFPGRMDHLNVPHATPPFAESAGRSLASR